jgi:pyruvate dehydrogenase E2 component (dihydrolipoamide acetyltransferase)
MAIPIEMPKLGNTVEECLLVRWNKHPGDRVSAGDLIAEIETDKATFELTAPVEGTILRAFFPEGELVPVFTNICVIGSPGESIEQFAPQKLAESARAEPSVPPRPVERRAPVSEAGFSPRARRFAREHDFYPQAVTGSGPGGRVLEEDLRGLYHASPRSSSLAKQYLRGGHELLGPGSGLNSMILARELGEPPIRISGVRERIARRMTESLTLSAQYTLNASADATGLLSLRNKIKAARQNCDFPDINIGDMVIFCAIKALIEMPELNAEFIDGGIHRRSGIHIGFACDTPRGLLVPVVKDCRSLSLEELSARIKVLTQQALEGAISPDDLSGGTFTVSNLGAFGIESFTPILNPPQVALLGVNAIQLKPVRREFDAGQKPGGSPEGLTPQGAEGGQVEFVEHIGLSLTCDHQVIDGAPAARFLARVRQNIENIESISGLKL